MMMHMPLFVLDSLFEGQEPNLQGYPPGFCGSTARASARAAGCSAPRTSPQAPKVPKVQPKPVIQQLAEATNNFTRTNLHELSDSYLIWADLPGLAREDISVTIKDDVLSITGQQKDPAADNNASSHLLAALRTRPRRAVDIKIPLKSDADLNGIQAKLSNGELTIAIPKRVPLHFSIPVLGGDEKSATSAAPALAQLPGPAQKAALSKPEQTSQETPAAAEESSIAEVPFPDVLMEHEQEAEEAHADASVTSETAAAAAEESAPAAAIATAPAEHKPATAEGPESDGSWEDVSDEEREAERSARRRKGLLPANGPVLDEVANEPTPVPTGQLVS